MHKGKIAFFILTGTLLYRLSLKVWMSLKLGDTIDYELGFGVISEIYVLVHCAALSPSDRKISVCSS